MTRFFQSALWWGRAATAAAATSFHASVLPTFCAPKKIEYAPYDVDHFKTHPKYADFDSISLVTKSLPFNETSAWNFFGSRYFEVKWKGTGLIDKMIVRSIFGEFKAHNSSNTTNLSRHLRCHRDVPAVASMLNTKTEDTAKKGLADARDVDGGKSAASIAAVNSAVVDWVLDSHQPLSEVDRDSFRRMMGFSRSQFKPLCARTIKEVWLPGYRSLIEKKISHILPQGHPFAIMLDPWTSRQNIGFLGVTALFVTPDWRLQRLVLDVRKLDLSHTAECIAETVRSILKDNGLRLEDVVVAVIDNAKNVQNACRDELRATVFNCVAHTLQLVIKDVLDNTPIARALLDATSQIASDMHRSAQLEGTMMQIFEAQTRVKSANTTRWTSDHDSAETVVTNKDAIKQSYEALGKDVPQVLNTSGINQLAALQAYLKPARDMTLRLQTLKTPSAGIALYELHRLLLNCNNPELSLASNVPASVKEMHRHLLQSVRTRFCNDDDVVQRLPPLMFVCAYVDPRLCHFKWLGESNERKAKELGKKYGANLANTYVEAVMADPSLTAAMKAKVGLMLRSSLYIYIYCMYIYAFEFK
jgi:hypothetical protein